MPTIQSLLQNTPVELRLETELLLARAMNWSRAKVLAFGEQTICDSLLPELEDRLERLRGGEPFAYITGQREFFGLEFKVTSDVLIPRPDTELIVELALAHCEPSSSVVDLGTGSGAIAVGLAHTRSDLVVTATDSSHAALTLAQSNATTHNCDIRFVQSHWFDELSERFDTIVSNPPYIRSDDPHLPALRHEPVSALVAGDNGLADIKTIISQAQHHLNKRGALFIEHGFDQADSVASVFREHDFVEIALHRDLSGQPRVTSGRLSTQRPTPSGKLL